MKENNFDSVSLKEQPSTEANEIELFKKIQVMQTMNPAIKALMNYRGKSVIISAYWSSFLKFGFKILFYLSYYFIQ